MNIKDCLTIGVKTAVSGIPYFGTFIAEIMDYGASNTEKKKTTQYFKCVDEKLSKCCADVEELKKDEFGFSMFVKSYRMWQVEAESSKLNCYANAVKNSYISNVSVTKKLLFANKLSEYSVELLELLHYFSIDHFVDESNENRLVFYGEEKMIDTILKELPKYNGNEDLLCYMVNSLIKDGFIKPFEFEIPLQKQKAYGKWTTKMGDEFLQFISDESEQKNN